MWPVKVSYKSSMERAILSNSGLSLRDLSSAIYVFLFWEKYRQTIFLINKGLYNFPKYKIRLYFQAADLLDFFMSCGLLAKE